MAAIYDKMTNLLSDAQKAALSDSLTPDNNSFDFTTGTTTLVGTNMFTALNATFANSSGNGRLQNAASSQGIVTLPFTTVANKRYQVQFDLIAVSDSAINVSLGSSAAYNASNQVTVKYPGSGFVLDVEYTADDTTSFLALQLTSSTSGHYVAIDNLKIYRVSIPTFTRESVIGQTETKGKTSIGESIDSGGTLGPIPLKPSAANKKTYPGAFSIDKLGLVDGLDFTDITGNIDDTIINSTWFRDKHSETT